MNGKGAEAFSYGGYKRSSLRKGLWAETRKKLVSKAGRDLGEGGVQQTCQFD